MSSTTPALYIFMAWTGTSVLNTPTNTSSVIMNQAIPFSETRAETPAWLLIQARHTEQSKKLPSQHGDIAHPR